MIASGGVERYRGVSVRTRLVTSGEFGQGWQPRPGTRPAPLPFRRRTRLAVPSGGDRRGVPPPAPLPAPDAGRDLFLAGIERALQPLDDPAEIMATVARLVGERLACDRCAYAEAEPDEDHFTMTGSYARGLPPLHGRMAMSDFSAETLRCMRAGEPYVVADAFTDERVLPQQREIYRRTGITAVVCVPLHKGGRFVAAMAVHQARPRVWTDAEIDLLTTVVARCWESLQRVHALDGVAGERGALPAARRARGGTAGARAGGQPPAAAAAGRHGGAVGGRDPGAGRRHHDRPAAAAARRRVGGRVGAARRRARRAGDAELAGRGAGAVAAHAARRRQPGHRRGVPRGAGVVRRRRRLGWALPGPAREPAAARLHGAGLPAA